MSQSALLQACLFLVLGCLAAAGREWRSADGSKTVEASFGGLKNERVLLIGKDNKTSMLALNALSAADQDFAKLAQVSLHGARVLGPQTLEITTVVDSGYIARLGLQLAGPKSPWVFSGETFFLPKGKLTLEQGDRLESTQLFYAGNRTFQPLEGDASIIRAFDITLDEAVNTDLRVRASAGSDPARLAPIVAEPLIEIVSTRGLALSLGKGFYVTEADLVKDVATLVLHEDGKDVPARIIKSDSKLGLALLSCAVDLEPMRLLARKPAELGQNIYTITLSLTSTRKNLGSPSLTRGIISKASSTTTFEHDAAIAENAVGGFVLSDKWEPLGVFFRSKSRSESKRPKKSASDPAPPPPAQNLSLRSEALTKLLIDGEKDKAKPIPGIPGLKAGNLGDAATAVIDVLRKSTALVIVTREIKHDPPAPKVAAGAAPPAAGQPQFSLSGSGTRHNFRCRYFNAAKLCQPTEGKVCKICGG